MSISYDTHRYREVKKLGTGGFSTVYLVKDHHADRYVALKDIKAVKMNKKNTTRLQDEFLILNSLKHKNLVEVYDIEFMSQTQSIYYTMEYCKKTNIVRFLKDKSDNDILKALIQSLRALYFIHSHDIIHFDIKPENFGITEEGQSFTIKLMDFGLFLPKSQIKPSSIRGTLQYMAPELFTRAEKDQRLDIYSLGMVFLKLLMLKNGIKKKDKYFDYSKLTGSEIAQIGQQNLLKVVRKMVQLKPEERFSDAYEVLEYINLLYRKNFKIIPEEDKASLFFEPRFTGRVNELNYLKVLLMASSGNTAHSTFMQVKGESGIGKSRLMKEFQIHSQLSGFKVKESYCLPANPPASVPIQLIKKLKPSEKDDIFSMLDENDQKLYEAVIDSREMNPLEDIEKRLDIKEKRETLFFSIMKLFDELMGHVEKKPVIMFVHDLHFIDEMSLSFLKLHFHKEKDIIWVLSVRTDFDYPEFIEGFLNEISRQKFSENVFLKALSADETTELLSHSFPINKFESKFYTYMYEKTAGNPLLITELLKTLIESDLLSVSQGKWEYEKEIFSMEQTGDKLEDILFYRVSSLKGLELFLAKFFAVLNAPVNIDFIRKYFQGSCNFESALTAMKEKRILFEKDGLYFLSHNKQKEAIHRMIDTEEHEEISLDLAYLNETLCVYPYEVTARLFLEGNLPDKALTYYEKAAEHYYSIYRNEKILEICTMLLELEKNKERKECYLETIIRTCLSQGKVSQARNFLNEYRDYPNTLYKKKNLSLFESILLDREGKIREAREKLFDFFNRHSKDLKRFEDLFEIYLNLGELFLKEGDINNAELYLKLAEGFIKDNSLNYKLEARLKQKTGMFYYYSGKLADADQYWQDTHELYRKNGFLPGLSTIISDMGLLDLKRGYIKVAAAKFQRSLDIQSNVGNTIQIILSSCMLSRAQKEMGQYTRAFELLEKSEEALELVNDVWTNIYFQIEKASLLIEVGEYVQAENALLVAGITSAETGYRRVQAKIDYLNALLLYKRGQLQESYRITKSVIESFRDLGGIDDMIMAYILKGKLLAKGGKRSKLRSVYKDLSTLVEQSQDTMSQIDFFIFHGILNPAGESEQKAIETSLANAVEMSAKAMMSPRHIEAMYYFQRFQLVTKGSNLHKDLLLDLQKMLKKQAVQVPEEHIQEYKNTEFYNTIKRFIKQWRKHD